MSIIIPPGAPTVIVRQGAHTVVIGNPQTRTIELVAKGPQGEEGPAGPPGPAGGNVVQYMAAGAVGGSRVVRLVPSGIGYASSANPLHGDDVVGITLQAGYDELINVQVAGEVVEPSWNWTPQDPVFLAFDGLMTQLPPEDPADAFSLVLGFATSPTSIMIRLETPIYF